MQPVVRQSLIGIVFSAILVGCGTSEQLMPVTGKVTVDGKPLTTGAVTFQPDGAKGNKTPHIAVGMLDAQGNYQLVSAERPGASLGWYKVTVTAQDKQDPSNPYALPKHLINPKFSDAQTSGLTVQVVEKPAAGAYDFKVTK